jgi:hypothetical protein
MHEVTARDSPDWLLLVLTLPGQQPALRMRIWRGLKTLGTAALRDGVYVLPRSTERLVALQNLAREVREAGGAARLLDVAAPMEEFAGAFDRTDEYRELGESISRAARRLRTRTSGLRDLQRLLRRYEAVVARDYFPGPARERTQRALEALRSRAERAGDVGEPHAAHAVVPRLDPSDYCGRTWVTRARPWIDRLASAWLIRRFIDPQATIRWRRPPVRQTRQVVGFDFDGASFSHQGDLVTFEVLLRSFSLESDARLRRVATIVHCLDVGGVPVAEASVLEAILRGMRERIRDDDLLLAQSSVLFDDLYDHGAGSATSGGLRA